MSYIKYDARMLGDERWVDAGADAFALHTWALSYCNEQGTDGRISARMAKRVALPLDPEHFRAAVDALLELGFWETDGQHGFVLVDYLAHGLAAQEQLQTREKWAADKRRQRLHRSGNHSLCTDRSCPAARALSTGGQVDTSTDDKWTTRPDQTRPDPTLREGRSRGAEQAAQGSARPPAAGGGGGEPPPVLTSHAYSDDCCGLPPSHPRHQIEGTV
ncbi:mucin-5AC [Nocardioidaceae bacterium Broad-1]|nr:mucin-5AC [Nocardioidaceae bacterium Broad-1]